MWSWLLGSNEDNSEERDAIKPVDKEWQTNLDSKDIKSDERKIEMNKNYEALFNHNAKEIRDVSRKDDTRNSLSKDALKETKDLLNNQTNNTRHLDNKDDIKDQLETDRSEKRGWFW